MFSEASQRGAERLRDILETYSRGSGQMVNRDKSTIFFSKNCTLGMKEVTVALDIHKEALTEKYIGFPNEVGRAANEVFEYIPTQVKGFIGG